MTQRGSGRDVGSWRARALMEEGRLAIARGLPNPVPQSVLVGVGLIMRRRLDKGDGAAPSETAQLAAQFLDRALRDIESRAEIACRRGCSHCCHFTVSASAPEVFLLARTVRARQAGSEGPFSAAVRARSEATRGAQLAELMRRCLPCPLLVEGACGAYAGRPIMCRQFLSRSAEICERSLHGDPVDIPVVNTAVNAGVLCRNLLLAATRSAGLSDACYELGSALAAALATDDAEERWRGGAPIFAEAIVVPRSGPIETMVTELAQLISAAAPPAGRRAAPRSRG